MNERICIIVVSDVGQYVIKVEHLPRKNDLLELPGVGMCQVRGVGFTFEVSDSGYIPSGVPRIHVGKVEK